MFEHHDIDGWALVRVGGEGSAGTKVPAAPGDRAEKE